ncbi:MAG: sensor histidine kinase [Bacteroidota bacterium]
MKPSKLMTRTLRTQLAYAGIVVVAGAFVFYFLLRGIYLHETDEALEHRLQQTANKLNLVSDPADLALWMKPDGDLEIRPAEGAPLKPEIITEMRFDSIEKELEPYRTLTAGVQYKGMPYLLVIRTSLVEDEDWLMGIMIAQIGLLVILLAGLVFVQQYMARRLWNPFYETLAYLRHFRLDRQTPILFAPGAVQEFNELNKALTELLTEQRRVYLVQKEFTENASHEMQTPLAVAHTKLELLAQDPALTEQQAVHLDALLSVTQRLARLNRSLLLLARIENNLFAGSEPVILHKVITGIFGQLTEQAEEAGLTFNLFLNADGFVETNQTLMEILVSNLLSNAVRHNIPGGSVTVRLSEAAFIIENTGKAVPLPSGSEFARFRKDASGVTGGVGLGLAISQQICDTCGLKLIYEFITPNLHRFTVKLA